MEPLVDLILMMGAVSLRYITATANETRTLNELEEASVA
jgi:hypothetical protein